MVDLKALRSNYSDEFREWWPHQRTPDTHHNVGWVENIWAAFKAGADKDKHTFDGDLNDGKRRNRTG